MYVSSKEAIKYYKVSADTLRRWADAGRIRCIKTDGNHRRYEINAPDPKPNRENIIYARVSSAKQADDLERQIAFIKERYPDYTVIHDIGSGINLKRKGLLSILDRIIRGEIQELVVSSKDRLARFGFDFIEWLCATFHTQLTVISNPTKNPEQDLTDDLMSIISVYAARYNGRRKYRIDDQNAKNSDISDTDSN